MIPKNKYPMNGVIEYNYNYTPKTSIIINYFTSVDTMIKTINNLRSLGDEVEIIVNNDNKGKDCEKIINALTHRNDRMVIANDLGEKRGYHHGAQISNSSEFLIVDDDNHKGDNTTPTSTSTSKISQTKLLPSIPSIPFIPFIP